MNSETDFQNVGISDDYPEGVRRLVQVGDTPVLIVRQDGQLRAFEDYCPHRAGPLSEGVFENGTVTCPWHGARFDLANGCVLSGPTRSPLRRRTVRLNGDSVEVSFRPCSADK